MKTSFLCVLLGLTAFGSSAAPPSAEQVLREAKAKAAAENKAVFLHFGASWCVGCKRLNKEGKLIINSMRPDSIGRTENIAYLGEPAREEWFITMIKRAAPEVSEDELKTLTTALKTDKK